VEQEGARASYVPDRKRKTILMVNEKLAGRVRRRLWQRGLVLHKSMREPDFGAIDGAIAGGFYQREIFSISRI